MGNFESGSELDGSRVDALNKITLACVKQVLSVFRDRQVSDDQTG